MRTLTKPVYYCGHCKRHGLSRPAMEKHEQHCTMNPERSCRWTIDGEQHEFPLPALAAKLRRLAALEPLDEADINWLHDEVGGCPACMLAALRQSGVEYHYDARGENLWNYQAEVERFREAEREDALEQERRDIESTFL